MRSTLYCVLCVLLTLALAACSLRYLHASWLLSFLYSLQLHATLACLAGTVLALALRRHVYGVFLLAWAAALVIHALVMLQEFRREPGPQALAAPHFRLLSFNIMGDNSENGEGIADYILSSRADVAVILEARPLFSQLGRLARVFPHRIGCDTDGEGCDLLLLSRRPFVETMKASLSDLRKNRFALARIDFAGRTLNIAAAHLTKPYYDQYHDEELYNLGELIEATEGPLLVAGDFNSDIIAPDMQAFIRNGDLATAPGEPRTWPVRAGAYGIAIDHVFARAPAELIETRRIADAFGSNHYGLVSEFAIAGSDLGNDPSSSSSPKSAAIMPPD